MENYNDKNEVSIQIEEISPEELQELEARAEILAEAISLPKKYREYFLQTKSAMHGLGLSLEPIKSPVNYPGQNHLAILLQRNSEDLEEDEAYDIFLKIRRRLRAKNLNTFCWKGKVYLRWMPDDDDDSGYETLRYLNGKAYYIFHVDK